MPKIDSLSPIAAGLLTLCFSFSAQTKELPLPSFPASFEEASFQGQKGCIPDDKKFHFAVMENEGMVPIGFHPLMEAPKVGVHIMTLIFNPKIGYGYTQAKRNDGMLCVYNKLNYMKFSADVPKVPPAIYSSRPITEVDCNFDSKAFNLCGSFEAITGRLTKAGYEYNWQGDLDGGFKLTMMTNDKQSLYIKTDMKTGATIITSAGKGVYKTYNVK